MSLLGLLAELETVFIVELDSVLMLLDELFTGRAPPRWLLAVVDFIDDELATSLLLDSTDDSLLEAFIDEVLLDDLIIEFFLLELFAELLIELDFLLEAFFDEALLDDLIIELFLLDASLELFTELLIELDFLFELFLLLLEILLELD